MIDVGSGLVFVFLAEFGAVNVERSVEMALIAPLFDFSICSTGHLSVVFGLVATVRRSQS